MTHVGIIGDGGREHALAWNIAKADEVKKVFYVSGKRNVGIEQEPKAGGESWINLDCTNPANYDALVDTLAGKGIDLLLVGPESPLNKGIVDHLHTRGFHRIVGPTQRAAEIECDKFYSFDIMNDANVPQANSIKCYSKEEAQRAINKMTTDKGVVIKYRYLAGGKGVRVCDNREEAFSSLEEIINTYGKHPTGKPHVLIAERLFGSEFSVFGISTGDHVIVFPVAIQDHKRLEDGDIGKMTGGMGAFGHYPFISYSVVNQVGSYMTRAIRAMKAQGSVYIGPLYAGTMMADIPRVLEFNCRFGDPENQVLMMLLKHSLYNPFALLLDKKLDQNYAFEMNEGAAVCVVMAARGYPDKAEIDLPLKGVLEAGEDQRVKIFHAQTTLKGGFLVNQGGRTLGITALGLADDPTDLLRNIRVAQQAAYAARRKIFAPHYYNRNDIAEKAFL